MTNIKRIVCFMLMAMLMIGCFQVGHAMVIEVPNSNNSNNNANTEPEEKEPEVEGESTFIDNGAGSSTASPTASPAATSAPSAEGLQYGKTNKAGVNIRHGRNTSAKVAGKIPNTGTAVIIKAQQESKKGELWYEVIYGKVEGYIRADLLDLITSSEYSTLAAAQQK